MINRKFITTTLLTGVFSFLLTLPLIAQNQNYSEMEKIQDEIENLYIKTYTIFEDYPNVTYEYVYDDGRVDAVEIYGITDNKTKKRLEVYMMDIADLENKILNETTRTGIYYVTETEPRPEEGLEEFYTDLRTYIDYPSINTSRTLEGTLYAKFVVDDEGEIGDVIFTSNFEDKDNVQVKAMKDETEKAILATSGTWEPAKVGDIPVSEWVVLPVQFNLKENYYHSIL